MLADTVREAAARFGSRPLFVDEAGTTTSFQEFDRLSDVAAHRFRSLGIGEGDVVACRLPSELAYVVAYAALAKLGAITAGINPKLSEREQRCLEELIQPVHTVCDETHLEPGPGAPIPALDPNPERTIALVFTSGTSGTPKAAEFRHRQLQAIRDLDLGDRRDTWGGGAAMFVSTQMPHVGFMTKLPWYLQTGATLHLMPKWSATRVLRLAISEAMPVIGGVAPQIALLLRSPALVDAQLHALKLLVVGGAASSPSLIEAAISRFEAAYSIRYSSTESGGIGLENTITPQMWEASQHGATHELADSIGRPRPGVAAKVVAEDGTDCAAEQTGELWLSSPALMSGYWNNPETTAATVHRGWLRTGDLARVRADGRFQLAGRRSEMYIRGGYNVFPAEVEQVLGAHPDVDEVAVVGVPDDLMGEVGLAAIVARPGSTAPSLQELTHWAAGQLADYKLPALLVEYEQLPLTAMQKVDKRSIASEIGRRTAQKPRGAAD